MRHFILFFAILGVLLGSPSLASAKAPVKTKKPTTWEPTTPTDYKPITWAKARGVASFVRIPQNGFLDYLTVVYLPYNQVKLIASSTPKTEWGPGNTSFATDTIKNWAFPKMIVEAAKESNPKATFMWNVPFFNITLPTTDLSLSLKSSDTSGPYITSGSRPAPDMAQPRRMLIIDNDKAVGSITDYDETTFIEQGDQAVEGFAPTVRPNGADVTARLFLGIRPGGQELVIYCSRSASLEEAVAALRAAGVPTESQMEADGGGSATCAYNMIGQYFVEPGRTLPHLMGTFPLVGRGTTTINMLNVRSGPGPKFKIVKKLETKLPIRIFEEKSGWMRIAEGDEWISSQYVKK